MVKLYGSYNSRFFALRLPGEIRLFQGVPAQFLWSRPIDDNVIDEILRIGDNGEIFLQGPRGVFRMRKDRHAMMEPINELCALARGDQEPVRLGGVRVNVDGREFCYERIQPETRLTDKIFRLLGSGSKGEPSVKAHQLVLHTLGSERNLAFFSALIDSKRTPNLQWAISPSFRYMVAAQPEKKGLHFQVIDIRDEAVTHEFALPIPEVSGVWINDQGSLLVDIRQVGMEKLVIARASGGKLEKFEVDPPPGYRVHHLGPDYVALKVTGGSPRLVVKHFDNSVLANAEVRPLIDMRVEFEFNFNERGNIDFLWWKDQQFQVRHTDVKSITTDAKRWDLTAQAVHQEQEQQLIYDATVSHEEERKRVEAAETSRQLQASMHPETMTYSSPALPQRPSGPLPGIGASRPPGASIPPPSHEAPFSRPEPVFAPPTASLTPPRPVPPLPPPGAPVHPIPPAGVAPGPPPPARPAVPPSRPATVPPGPPDKGFLRSPPGPPPMTEDDPGFLRTPPGPPPDTETVPSPFRPPPGEPGAPVQPERPQAPFGMVPPGPPPSTEGSTGVLFVEPSPMTEAAPMGAVEARSVAGLSAADIDNELEKLRMHYIAGEVGRDDYYQRRSELEAARKQAVVRASTTPGGPKRLELEVDPAGEVPAPPPPPLPGTPGGRRIDLSQSLDLETDLEGS